MAGAKLCSTAVLNGLLLSIVDRSTTFYINVVTSSSPLSIAASSTSQTDCLVHSSLGGIPTTAFFTFGDSSNNRYMTISACSCDSVLNTGIAANVIIINATCTEVMYATTCTTQTLTAGNKCNIGSWTITVNQPT